MWSFVRLRTITLDVTRLATLVADGPCSSRGNTWHCSDFSWLMLAGLGVTRSLVCKWLHLQYWWALAHCVSWPQAWGLQAQHDDCPGPMWTELLLGNIGAAQCVDDLCAHIKVLTSAFGKKD